MLKFYPRLAKLTKAAPPSSSPQGFTLLEVILAVVVVGTTLALIAPALTLAAATRLQNRRAEQAMALAQQEVDRIQAAMTRGGREAEAANLPPIASGTIECIADVEAPTAIINTPADNVEARRNAADEALSAYTVDLDEDAEESGADQASNDDFFVQRFRDEGLRTIAGGDELSIFRVGVRVYSLAAQDRLGSLETEPATLKTVEGLGEQHRRPLAVLYTEISQGNQDISLQRYSEYITAIGRGPATEDDDECL